MNKQDIALIERLNQHPKLRTRMKELLDVVENVAGDCTKADDAEQFVIDELRKMGNDALSSWAERAAKDACNNLDKETKGLYKDGKKVRWNTTFGEISVLESVYRHSGKRLRPFMISSGVSSRCSSLPLQRVITDFGADNPFGKVSNKLREHYGIEMSTSTIRSITLSHGEKMYEQQKLEKQELPKAGVAVQIGEIDGCMIPIMTPSEDATDKRKNKTLHWKECRLALVHEEGSLSPQFSATFEGDVNDVGKGLKNCAISAGFGSQTHFHSVGDGAVWIANQVSDKFGSQSSYLIDFYHVCEYLTDASKSCVDINPEVWVDQQKKHLKNNDYQLVIDNLFPHIEESHIEDSKAPVRACHRYLSNRTHQLDYKGAIEKGLPIGSGEVESAHRYVIQKRLKLSGAWWKASNVDPMLSLRVIRENREWEDYWKNLRVA